MPGMVDLLLGLVKTSHPLTCELHVYLFADTYSNLQVGSVVCILY